MKLRAQLLLSACGTALIFGGLGTCMMQRRAAVHGAQLLDGALQTGEVALRRQWHYRRAERRAIYRGIAGQTYFRAYLLAADRGQMDSFANQVQKAGADAVLILDAQGGVLAALGDEDGSLRAAARRGSLSDAGTLLSVGGKVADVHRLPVGGERPVGYLVTASRLAHDTLHADAEPFGVEVALAVEGAFVSSLDPATAKAAQRALLEPGTSHLELASPTGRIRVRVTLLDGARMMVTVPVERIGALTTEATQQLSLLLFLMVAVAGGGALMVIGRVTGPIERLMRAANQLGQGRLAASAAELTTFRGRSDEIGALAQALEDAAHKLSIIAATSNELSRTIGRALTAADHSASSVATGAERQEHRVRELTASFGPLVDAVAQSSTGLIDAQAKLRELSSAIGQAERLTHSAGWAAARLASLVVDGKRKSQGLMDPVALRLFGSLLAQVEVITSSVNQQRGAHHGLGEAADGLRRKIEEVLSLQIHERHRGGLAKRALDEIGRVANGHALEARTLRVSAVELRRDLDRLTHTLEFLQPGGKELVPAASAESPTSAKPDADRQEEKPRVKAV